MDLVVSQELDKQIIQPHEKEDVRKAVDQNTYLTESLQQLCNENEELLKIYANLQKRYEAKLRKRNILERKYTRLKKRNKIKEQKNLLSQVFSTSQINVLLNKKKVYWSDDDMAMAFTLRQIGNRDSYLFLKQNLNMPLPSLSSVQKWTASK